MIPQCPESLWRISIDTGGTFTDAIGVDPRGGVHRVKVPSSGRLPGVLARSGDEVRLRTAHALPAGWLEGFLVSARGAAAASLRVEEDAGPCGVRLAAIAAAEPLEGEGEFAIELTSGFSAARLAAAIILQEPPSRISTPLELRLATTRATNALLERRCGRTLFVATEGFADLLRIGDQSRPEIFALSIRRPPPLHERVIEARHRLEPDGSTLRALDRQRLFEDAVRLREGGLETAAISLLHAPAAPHAEREVAAILRDAGFRQIVLSTDLSLRSGYLDRSRTAVAEAALGETIREFIASAARTEEPIRVLAMTSAGGLVRGESLRATESLLSGPAAGAIGAASLAAACGLDRAIGFDMGGTSTDVARFDGPPRLRPFVEAGGERLMLPSLEIETVAAGGGSIAYLREDGRLEVGPRSAGADPGPACYGRGGPLTVTDVNLLLGRADPEQFGVPLDTAAAEARAAELHAEVIARDAGEKLRLEEMLAAILAIADERMAGAIERVSTREGFDPAAHALVAFGGAGGQHACAIAERLGIGKVLLPAAAGVLSAFGLAHAARRRVLEKPLLAPLAEAAPRLLEIADSLQGDALEALAADGVERSAASIERASAFLRLLGQESSIEVAIAPIESLAARFAGAFAEQHGYAMPDRQIEIESLRVEAAERATAAAALPPLQPRAAPPPRRRQRVQLDGRWVDAAVFARRDLLPGMAIDGPAIVADETATSLLGAGWRGELRGDGSIVATRVALRSSTRSGRRGSVRNSTPHISGRPPLRPELLAARLASIAEEMGERLRRCSLSVNIRHRLDYSTAILDPRGRLVETAAHLPVHLGALGHAARAALAAVELGPGDAVLLNHPAFGGSHLPDLTLLTPVHDDRGALLAILANRAHHAEIGGILPGSMAPSATCLEEEGVAIPPMHLLRGGRERFAEFERLLRQARHPSRAPADNLADLEAQLAANQLGAARLRGLLREIGADAFREGLDQISRLGSEAVARALPTLLPQPRRARVELDDGTPIEVRLSQSEGRMSIDFSGSGGPHPGNLNAPLAVTHSAVLYTLRLLLAADLPLNEGLMERLDLLVPPGVLNPTFRGDPTSDPAVAAGNTETSQRIVEALLLAFDRIAPSQGTMNNVLFGNASFGFYETVGGGAGGTQWGPGESGVHSHMTNTRISDPEHLERRVPVRIEAFAIRGGSGGAGRHRGGDGLRRVYRFTAPLDLSIVSQHRREGPPGIAGGEAGVPGRQSLQRCDGSVEPIAATAAIEVEPGDRLELLTPGGGGWGDPSA